MDTATPSSTTGGVDVHMREAGWVGPSFINQVLTSKAGFLDSHARGVLQMQE